MTKQLSKAPTELIAQELILTWVVLNRQVTQGKAVPRMYNDLSQERIALSIIAKIDKHEDDPEKGMKKFKDGEVVLTTEEKGLILKFLGEFPMALEEIKTKHILIEKLS